MNTDNMWIVLVILFVILVGSNALMFAIVRGSKGMNFKWFKDTRKQIGRPWGQEDESLEELSRRVHDLKRQQEADDNETHT